MSGFKSPVALLGSENVLNSRNHIFPDFELVHFRWLCESAGTHSKPQWRVRKLVDTPRTKRLQHQFFCLYEPDIFSFAPIRFIIGTNNLCRVFLPLIELHLTYRNIYRLLVAISLNSQYLIPQHFVHKNQFFPKYETSILARVFRVLLF